VINLIVEAHTRQSEGLISPCPQLCAVSAEGDAAIRKRINDGLWVCDQLNCRSTYEAVGRL
jgi:nitrate reductase beta subunit